MSVQKPTPRFPIPRAQPSSFSNGSNVQKVLLKGRNASSEFSSQTRREAPSHKNLITAGSLIDGVYQNFVLEAQHPVSISNNLSFCKVLMSHKLHAQATIVIPCTLAENVKQEEVFCLLEAQRVELLLIDIITSSATSNISNQYYSQLLMAQRLQRAELEVALYKIAIEKDGLCLLEGMHDFSRISLVLIRYLQNV